MFWNEFDYDCSVTTVLDETGQYDDVELLIYDDVVYIKQYNMESRLEIPDIIALTPKMFKDLMSAMNYPEGMYKTVYKKK